MKYIFCLPDGPDSAEGGSQLIPVTTAADIEEAISELLRDGFSFCRIRWVSDSDCQPIQLTLGDEK